MKNEFKFQLPIGDWSDDGYCKCDYYVIKSNKPAIEIISIYNEMDKIYNISKQCAEYQDNTLTSEFLELLKSNNIDSSKYCDEDMYIETSQMALLIIDLLMQFDTNLELEIIQPDEIPMLNNWLAQSFKMSLDLPGYGLFD